MDNKRAQSTIEYLLILTAVISILIIFLKPDGILDKAFTYTQTRGAFDMVNMVGRAFRETP